MTNSISKNTLSFIALAHEFCSTLQDLNSMEQNDFVDKMTKLLPRIYITISDIKVDETSELTYIEPYLEEIYYDEIRNNLASKMGENDTYLEVFDNDMKYSDTPIGASISESLADIFQELFNYLSNVKDAPNEIINSCTLACYDNFKDYWGQTLCNVMRPLNSIKFENDI